MRHQMSGRKLGRTSSHRKAMFANMATSLLRHEQIKTTLPKAKDLRRIVEPLITAARNGAGTPQELAARRQVMRTVRDESVVRKLFDELAPLFKNRPGGYTRVLKAGFRKGDDAPMAIIELTEKSVKAAPATAEKTPEASKAKGVKASESKPAAKEEKKAAPKAKEAKATETEKKPAKKAAASDEKKKTAEKPAKKKAEKKKDN